MTDEQFEEITPSIESLEAFSSLTIRASSLTDDSAHVLANIMLKHRLTVTDVSINGGSSVFLFSKKLVTHFAISRF